MPGETILAMGGLQTGEDSPVPKFRAGMLRAFLIERQSEAVRELERVPENEFLTDGDVLHTIAQMGMAMERTPTAAKFKEEELRNLVLIVLNANFEGAARGEVFNGEGKTDILLPWEGENAFIGECKVWNGPRKFRASVDQLHRYATWRDTKAALVVFIKRGMRPTSSARLAARLPHTQPS